MEVFEEIWEVILESKFIFIIFVFEFFYLDYWVFRNWCLYFWVFGCIFEFVGFYGIGLDIVLFDIFFVVLFRCLVLSCKFDIFCSFVIY